MVAIALPYTGVFAKVYSEMLEEADRRPDELLPPNTSAIARFVYARLPIALAPFKIYTMYRVECGLRSSAVLGFIGLPTLGFELDAFFKVAKFESVAAVLIIYYVLIGTIRWWLRPVLLPFYLIGSIALLSRWAARPSNWRTCSDFSRRTSFHSLCAMPTCLSVRPGAHSGPGFP